MTRYRCTNIPGDWMAPSEIPMCCSYTDCKPCRAIMRARPPFGEPTVTEDDREAPDPDDAPYDHRDKDPDLMRSPR